LRILSRKLHSGFWRIFSIRIALFIPQMKLTAHRARPWPYCLHELLIVAGLLGLAAGCKESAGGAGAVTARPLPPPKVELGPVACLATHWHPDGPPDQKQIENVLLRELVRQGVLIAIREEMGLVTRDETLQEPFPESAESSKPASAKSASHATAAESNAAAPLEVDLEATHSGRWTASLYGAGAVAENPVWRH